MKKKAIIEQLKEKAALEMTDVIHRIDLDSINIEEPESSFKKPFNLKKTFIYTFASLFIFVSGFLLYSLVINPIVDNPLPLASETEIAGFQTVTAAALLTSFDVEELSLEQDSYPVIELAESAFDLEDELGLVTTYLNLAETSIGNEDSFIYLSVDSDIETYTYAFEYRSMDLSGNLIEYKGYYNLEDSNGNYEEHGILVHNQRSFAYASSTEQTDNGAIKRYRIYMDQQNYVEVINYSTDSIQKFSYKIYKNSVLDNTSSITIKSQQNRLEATIEITNKHNNEITLDLSRNMANETEQYFNVKYTYHKNSQSLTGEFTVDLALNSGTGEYQYQYRYGNQTFVQNRVEKGNKKASNEDFNPGNGNQSTASQNTEDNQGKKNGSKKNKTHINNTLINSI